MPRPENAELYKKYRILANQTPDVYFVGRLATYKYYNMDQVVAQALTLFKRISANENIMLTENKCLTSSRKVHKLELWGGLECTINRVGDQFRDQLETAGHYYRENDIDEIAALGIRTIRYPILWGKTSTCRNRKA